MLKDQAMKYYLAENYNCAETIIRAGNDYYDLGLCDHDMKMVAAFGGGIQTGNTCGAVLSAASVLSMKYVEQRAHESTDIKPVTSQMLRKVKEKMGSTLCREIKPVFFNPQDRCRKTVETACDILEQVIDEYEKSKN